MSIISADHQFGPPPIEGRIESAGVSLRYLDWGSPGRPEVLFLHGGGLTAHSWDVVCDLLRRNYRCCAIDLRGHGESEWSTDANYTLEAHAADIAATVDGLGLDAPAIVGHSLGGLVALTYAGLPDAGVSRLVLVDTGPRGGRPAGRERLRAFMDGPEEHATVDEFVERAMAFNPRRSRERLRRSLLHNLRETDRGTWTWKYDRRITEPFRRGDPEQRRRRLLVAAADLRCPVLVVRGGESEHFQTEDAEATAALFQDGRWATVSGAGHTIQGDRPYDLASLIDEFLASSDTARRP